VIDLLHHLQPSLVVKSPRELCEPGAQVVGDAVRYPDSNLRIALDRILPAIWLFDSNAEDTDDGLSSQSGAILLAVFPIGPGDGKAPARLAVGKQRFREVADGLHVERTQGAPSRVGDERSRRVDLADFPVPEPPELEQALLSPEDVAPSRRVLGVVRPRQLHARRLLEI